jgi:chemotaxis protein MotB
MLALFSERYGIARERLAVVGYAETVPLESNESSEGRARNRRVDVVILNEMGMRPEARPQVAQKIAGNRG